MSEPTTISLLSVLCSLNNTTRGRGAKCKTENYSLHQTSCTFDNDMVFVFLLLADDALFSIHISE
jgi:hypothetical protein